MSMLTSYTLPGLAPAPGKFSPAALNLHKRPAVASSQMAHLPWAPCNKEIRSRARLFTCHVKHKYDDIPPTALVHPTALGGGDHKNWSIAEDEDHITLKLDVGETNKKDLEVAKIDEEKLLIVRYTGDRKGENPASELDVRLMMPAGYDFNKVKASILPNGRWLEVTIAKPKIPPTPIPIN